MWTHWRSLRIVSLVYGLMAGLQPVSWTPNSATLRNSPLLRVYLAIHNGVLLILLPLNLKFNYHNIQDYASFPMAELSHVVLALMHTFIVLLTIAFRRRCEQSLGAIVDELTLVEQTYFDKSKLRLRSAQLMRYDLMLYTKVAIQGFYFFYTAYSLVDFLWQGQLFTGRAVILVITVTNIFYILSFHYFIILWHICKRFQWLGEHLSVLRKEAADQIDDIFAPDEAKFIHWQLALDLVELSTVYTRLCRLHQQLNASHKYQVFIIIVAYFTHNVYIGYYAVVVFSGHVRTADFFSVVLDACVYITMYTNAFLYEYLFHRVTQLPAEMRNILRKFTELPAADAQFERNSEFVSLQWIQHRPIISALGLFEINRHFSFSTLAMIVLYVIIMVQNDYKRIYNLAPLNSDRWRLS